MLVVLIGSWFAPAALAANTLDGEVDPSATLGDGITVELGAWVGPGASLGDGVVVEAGATVGPKAVIGAGSRVGAGSVIGRRAVVLDGVVLPENSAIARAAFVGRDTQVSASLALGYAAVLGDGVRSDTLALGNLAVLGGPAGAATAIDCPDLRLGRGARVAMQAPYSLRCADPSGLGVRVGPDAAVEPEATLGGGVTLRRGAHVGQRAVLGESAIVGRDACVDDSAGLGDRARVGASAVLGQDAQLGEDGVVARGELLGSGCGVWPDGEPGGVIGAGPGGWPQFAATAPADPDPGSAPPLAGGGACDPGGVYVVVTDGSAMNSGYYDDSIRLVDPSGAVTVLQDPLPEVRAILPRADGGLFVGFARRGIYATQVDPSLAFAVVDYPTPTSPPTVLQTFGAYYEEHAVGLALDGGVLSFITKTYTSGPGIVQNKLYALDPGAPPAAVLRSGLGWYAEDVVTDAQGRLSWLYDGHIVSLDGLTELATPIPVSGDEYPQSLAFAPDGSVLWHAMEFTFPAFEMFGSLHRFDPVAGTSALVADAIDGSPNFSIAGMRVDCTGTLWMVAQVDYGESGLYEWPEGGSPVLRYRPTEPNHSLTGTLAIAP